MAFKQPRIPEYRESEGIERYIRSLILFLKDFCMDVWAANSRRAKEIEAVKSSIPETPEIPEVNYPVTSVNGQTGDVKLAAADVGALDQGGAAADSAKLGGRTWSELMLLIYPVGAIYQSVNATSPASLFGGTWTQLKDRFLLGAGSTYTNAKTGGAATHTLTTAQMPAHTHEHYASSATPGNNLDGGLMISSLNLYNYKMTKAIASTGGGEAHNNMPPYLVIYMWKRVS